MDVVSVLGIVSAIVFIGFLSEQIFRKTDIPDVLLLIGVGIIINSVLGWTDPNNFGESSALFTTFALIFILFQGALSIEFKTLMKSLPKTFKLTLLTFFLTVLVVSTISYFLGYSVEIAILIGMILGGTSSAVVIPLVNSVDIRNKYGSVLTLESALSDVLCIIGTVTVLEIIETGKVVASGIFNSVLSSFSLALIVGLAMGFAWIFILSKNESILNSYLLTVAVVVGLYAFVEGPFVGASGAIAVLMFGLVLGNSRQILTFVKKEEHEEELEHKKELKKKHKKTRIDKSTEAVVETKVLMNVLSADAKNFFSQISFFVKTFFFVYLGILIDFSNTDIFLYGAILTAGIYLIRPFAVKMTFAKDHYLENDERTLLEILIPKGLAAAVLAGLAVQSGVLGNVAGEFTNMILSVVLLSIFLTSILIFLTEKNIFKGFLPFIHHKKKEE